MSYRGLPGLDERRGRQECKDLGWETAGSRVAWGQGPAIDCIAHFSGVPLVEGMQLGISHSLLAFPI